MCGICGIIDYTHNKIEEQTIREMCSKMRHRGPDAEGAYISHDTINAGLGHCRLSIIDLSLNANQPISNEENNIYLVINGEIYNFKILREELEQKGHRFKSKSDSEVALHLYEEYGEDFVKYLRGAFAFGIWDGRQKKLILGRDRIGKKPLIYSNIAGRFCFASEFSALLASGLIKKEIDFEALHYYLSFGYIPAPLTIYKNVFKLLPAHLLILKEGRINSYPYWDLDYTHKLNITLPEAQDGLLRELKEAINIRLYSDVPLGVFLSGGIDSSTVVALMSQLYHNKIKTFSIGFNERDYDELKYAKRIAKFFNTEHYEFIVKPNALEVLPILVERYGEPYADSSCIPTYYVSKMAKKYVTVALNGDGGDESFAGYERYQAVYLSEIYNKIPHAFKKMGTLTLLKLLPGSINPKNPYRKLRRFLENASLPFYSRYLHWIRMLSEEDKQSLYTIDFYAKVKQHNPIKCLREHSSLIEHLELLDRLLYIDIKTNLANDLVVKMDIATMSNSLEGRSPFLDQKVMEFCATLPVKFKMRNFIKKYILKKMTKEFLPFQNINRKKMGFGVPVGYWMRNELKDYVNATLLSEKALNRGYFKEEALKNYIHEHIAGLKDHSSGLWTLLMLELWHQRFID